MRALILAALLWPHSGAADEGRVICRMETQTSRGGEVVYVTLYRVDPQGRLASQEVVTGGATTSRTRYQRDGRGRIVENCFFDVQGQKETPNGCARFHYRGAEAHPFEEEDVGSDGVVAARATFKWDARGRLRERRVKVSGSPRVTVYAPSYRPDGRVLELRVDDPLMGPQTIRYRYQAGQRVEETLGPEGPVRSYRPPCPPEVLLDAS